MSRKFSIIEWEFQMLAVFFSSNPDRNVGSPGEEKFILVTFLPQLMTEILFGIRVIKFYTWEPLFTRKVADCRRQELSHLKAIKYLDALCVYTWAALPVVISILTFVTYVLLGHQLTAAKVAPAA